MNKVEQIIHKQYQELVSNFRPEFGNLRHIRISKEIASMNKLQVEYEKKIEATHDIKIIRDDIRKLKRQILYLLKD